MMKRLFVIFSGDGDITEQIEPLLSESQDESLTLLGHHEATTAEEHKSIINVNDDLDESITPLLGDEDDCKVMNSLFNYFTFAPL